ncbi:MAG: DUF2721 domain-containing protein [Gemmatimonadales bacterium]
MMLQLGTRVADIAHVIQLAVAPVFLLSGVAATLTVLTNRLARIIDRARNIETALPSALADAIDGLHRELNTLSRRATLIHRAITLCTACALLICVVIIMLFLGALLTTEISALTALVFIVALCAYLGALVSFLLEIRVATASMSFGPK